LQVYLLIARILKDIEFRTQQRKIRLALESGLGSEVFDWYICGYQSSEDKRNNSAPDIQKQKSDLNFRNFHSSLRKLVSKYERIVDIGCGDWELLSLKNAPESVGIDLSRVTLHVLKKGGFKGQVVLGDCAHLPFRSGVFDFALSNQVVEHMLSLDDVSKAILEMERVSKTIAVITPNAMLHYRINDKTHFQFLTSKSLKRIMGDCDVYGTGQIVELLNYWLIYERARYFPLFGRFIYESFLKLDYSRLVEALTKRLWHGTQLIALKKTA
jgi:ubiquinone/menaquinone biosynthesis C-methylase UbiE